MKRSINRKKIIFAVLIGFILFLVAGYFLILTRKEQEDSIETTKNLFPFGEVSTGVGDIIGNLQNTNNSEKGQSTDEPEPEPAPETLEPRLRQISNFPTGGFGSLIKTEEKEITDIQVDEEGNSTQIIKTVDIENQFVRYTTIDDASIYESKITSNQISSENIVENFIPNAEHAFFDISGNNILFQYWNNNDQAIESYLTSIKPIQLDIDECPYDFSPINLGDDELRIVGFHEFLNKNPQTQLAREGINSPGNETSLVVEETITAIKNFQSLYQIDIDGELGPQTQEKMKEVCDQDQKKIAQAEFDALEKKYNLSGFFLPQNIVAASMSPELPELFYLTKDNLGVIGYVHDLIENTKTSVFESPFTEWLTNWTGPESINITTKPSYRATGYSYQLNPIDQRYFKTLGNKNGLLVYNNADSSKAIVSYIENNVLETGIYDFVTNRIVPLLIQTFPEKCTWASDNITLYCAVPNALANRDQYPDTWYQGRELFTDTLWKINTETFQEEIISNIPIEYENISLDIIKIAISPKDEYLYFIDKKTEYLWSYRLVDF